MILGFTGTRIGMTLEQKETVSTFINRPSASFEEVHHGDCVGADAAMHDIAVASGLKTVGHIPSNPELRAFCEFDETMPEKAYLTRNRAIVHACDILLATPGEMKEQTRGGTWYTISYARMLKKPLIIVWPDGSITEENK